MSNQINQERCPKDDALGALIEVKVTRANGLLHDTPFVKAVWMCSSCFDSFETDVTYLEITKME